MGIKVVDRHLRRRVFDRVRGFGWIAVVLVWTTDVCVFGLNSVVACIARVVGGWADTLSSSI